MSRPSWPDAGRAAPWNSVAACRSAGAARRKWPRAISPLARALRARRKEAYRAWRLSSLRTTPPKPTTVASRSLGSHTARAKGKEDVEVGRQYNQWQAIPQPARVRLIDFGRSSLPLRLIAGRCEGAHVRRVPPSFQSLLSWMIAGRLKSPACMTSAAAGFNPCLVRRRAI